MLTTAAANVVFWAWPAAPPRFSVPGMTNILLTRDILGAAHPRGTTSLADLYAAMPSLHVAWCAALTLTGTPPAAAVLVYRVTGCWAVDATGAVAVVTLARRRPRGPLHPDPRHGSARTAAAEDSTPKPPFE